LDPLRAPTVELAVPVKSRLENTNASMAPPEECHSAVDVKQATAFLGGGEARTGELSAALKKTLLQQQRRRALRQYAGTL
jgi:hypothetical protein